MNIDFKDGIRVFQQRGLTTCLYWSILNSIGCILDPAYIQIIEKYFPIIGALAVGVEKKSYSIASSTLNRIGENSPNENSRQALLTGTINNFMAQVLEDIPKSTTQKLEILGQIKQSLEKIPTSLMTDEKLKNILLHFIRVSLINRGSTFFNHRTVAADRCLELLNQPAYISLRELLLESDKPIDATHLIQLAEEVFCAEEPFVGEVLSHKRWLTI